MKIDFKVIYARDTEYGDVFYCMPSSEMNEFGPSAIVTGTDQILIRDEYCEEDEKGNYAVVVNGGYIT